MKEAVRKLKIGICQMPVIPGDPKSNADYIVGQINKAISQGCDIFITPELAVPGYCLGDDWEVDAFMEEIFFQNKRIIKSSQDYNLAIVLGTSSHCLKNCQAIIKCGEDGRSVKFNNAIIIQNGEIKKVYIKTNQPNYRIFNDSRHFYSNRQLMEKSLLADGELNLKDCFEPASIATKFGRINLGIMLCEDGWYEDYNFNPGLILAKNGADILIDISASPWTWQKNRARHRVLGNLLRDIGSDIPLIYVNCVGTQDVGHNMVIFDGSSTVYSPDGEIFWKAEPYKEGTTIISFSDHKLEIIPEADDTTQLFNALKRGVKYFCDRFPKVAIGISGGIDSALSAAFFTHLLGPDRVIGVNMPSIYSSEDLKNIATELAKNLNIELLTIPIGEQVDIIANQLLIEKGTLAYENIQARVRMNILASLAQSRQGVFIANFNKTEAAFGYGTLYGDIAGCCAPFGDLVKREIYQLAQFLNEKIFDHKVIPSICFDIPPTAELNISQLDPFDYGNLERRGYHDELVRAFTEFRLHPFDILKLYSENKLADRFQIKEKILGTLFPNVIDFINDLENKWSLFRGQYFKRKQGPPNFIVSKRSFGQDLRETQFGQPYLTHKYEQLKKKLIEAHLLVKGQNL